MTCGLSLTLIFPFRPCQLGAADHRPDHACQLRHRQRRWDRVTGTLIGCALAVTFITTMPAPVLLLLIVLAVGTSHAYGLVAYRITAVGASIVAVAAAFRRSAGPPQFFERIIDTMIGAGLSWAFSYLLPNWERDDLPRTVRGCWYDAAFAQAALRRAPVDQPYRLARKRRWTRWRNSGAIRRLATTMPTAALWRRWVSRPPRTGWKRMPPHVRLA
jgi:uncharacterized membrane protein YccC